MIDNYITSREIAERLVKLNDTQATIILYYFVGYVWGDLSEENKNHLIEVIEDAENRGVKDERKERR